MMEAFAMNRRCLFRAMTLISAASAPLAAALIAQPACAQQASGPVSDSGDEIVVTAQKREESLQKVPISISVLGGKVLDKQATGGTLEALGQVPGVSLTPTSIGNSTAISIRGVAPGSPFLDGSGTVGYYLDSIPFSLVKSSTVPNTNAYDMARVEVLRGPQGTLYGASALNGVVRILTNDADPTKFELKARGGVMATKGGDPGFRADAAVNIPLIADKLAIRVVGGVESLGGWLDQPLLGKKDANSTFSKNLRIKLNARPTDNLKIDLAAWFSRSRDDAPPYAKDGANQTTPLRLPQTNDYDAYSARISYDLPFMTITSATSYLTMNRTSEADYAWVGIPVLLSSDLPAKVFSEELLFNSNSSGPWRWSAGAFYRKAHDDLYQTLPVVLPGPIYWRDSSKSYAVYGQLTRSFADGRFELSGGLRYFHDDVAIQELDTPGGFLPLVGRREKFHAVTPRIVATWLPSSRFTAYASYSQGFRSGFNQSPLALASTPGLPSVDADKLHNYEIGAKGGLLDGFATYDLSVYYIKWKGVQQTAAVLYNGAVIGASLNGSSASGAGVDFALTLHPAEGLQVGGAVSYNDLHQDDDVLGPGNVIFYPKGARLAYSAGLTANAFANYNFPLNDSLDASIKLSANYRSSQTIDDPDTAVGTFTSGKPMLVDASFEVANHHDQSLSVYVQNLTNWNGVTVPSPLQGKGDSSVYYRTRPRTIGIQFETKF